MYKEVLRSIEGIEIFPIVSLLIFFAFFVAMLIWCLKADKQAMHRAAMLPLEPDTSLSPAGAKRND